MNSSSDYLGLDPRKSSGSSSSYPQYGRGLFFIQMLRILLYIVAAVIFFLGLGVASMVSQYFNSSVGILPVLVVIFSIVLALLAIFSRMVYLDIAANTRSAANNTAMLLEHYEEDRGNVE